MKHGSTSLPCIFVSAYAINPFKGSEDGMGWNFVCQIARHQRVIAVTRKNNRPAIEKYQAEHPEMSDLFARMDFRYYDWPKSLLFWKKGPVLSLIYYYFWQLGLALHFRSLRHTVDVAHNLNFHNDWTPTFLWMWGKPLVWGPVGHHPRIPYGFLRPFYAFSAVLRDRFLWSLKWMFWHFDPFLKISRRKADHIFCMHEEAAQKLKLSGKYSILPSVASEMVEPGSPGSSFTVLSAGRLVSLKGFDITIKAFHRFYMQLDAKQRDAVRLRIVGSGPEKQRLQQLIAACQLEAHVEIIEWIPRAELMELYRSASVFLFPSHEGAGMVVAEALSFGVPVLCWDNCGPGRFIHPDSPLKVPYEPQSDWAGAFASHLMQLYTNAEFAQTEHARARERYMQFFRWDARAAQLRDVYAAVIAQDGAVTLDSSSLQTQTA